MKTIIINADCPRISDVNIGRQGENEYREIQIHFPRWLKEWPGATVSAVYWRPDGKNIIIESGTTESPIIWHPKKTDLAVDGIGQVELRLTRGETRGKKPPIRVHIRATPREGDDPPESERKATAG